MRIYSNRSTILTKFTEIRYEMIEILQKNIRNNKINQLHFITVAGIVIYLSNYSAKNYNYLFTAHIWTKGRSIIYLKNILVDFDLFFFEWSQYLLRCSTSKTKWSKSLQQCVHCTYEYDCIADLWQWHSKCDMCHSQI